MEDETTTTLSVELVFWSSPCIHNHSWTSISTCSLLWNQWRLSLLQQANIW